MAATHFYNVQLTWDNERKGTLRSDVLNHHLEVATPPEFPKGMPGIWSPEHLLVAAVNSCLMTTFLAVAENFKLPFAHFESNATGKLEVVNGKYMISEIELIPVLTITDEADREKADKVLVKAEAACLISNSVKSTIIFKPAVLIQELVS
jgi:peroxiredoxin-like protein